MTNDGNPVEIAQALERENTRGLDHALDQAGEPSRFKHDRSKDGRIVYMAHAKNYVMVRRPGCVPFVLTEKEWRTLPILLNQEGSR